MALLELPDRFFSTRKSILGEGQRDGDFTVTTIDEKTGRITAQNGREQIQLQLELEPGEELAGRTIHFRDAALAQVLDIYQELIGRTVISRLFVSERFTLKSGAALSREQATAFLEAGLAEKGIGVRLSGSKFVFVTRAEQLHHFSALPEPPKDHLSARLFRSQRLDQWRTCSRRG
jgi:hypothetical protein